MDEQKTEGVEYPGAETDGRLRVSEPEPMVPDGIVTYGLTHDDEIVVRLCSRDGWLEWRSGLKLKDWVAPL
jgi:hypothetical protein